MVVLKLQFLKNLIHNYYTKFYLQRSCVLVVDGRERFLDGERTLNLGTAIPIMLKSENEYNNYLEMAALLKYKIWWKKPIEKILFMYTTV